MTDDFWAWNTQNTQNTRPHCIKILEVIYFVYCYFFVALFDSIAGRKSLTETEVMTCRVARSTGWAAGAAQCLWTETSKVRCWPGTFMHVKLHSLFLSLTYFLSPSLLSQSNKNESGLKELPQKKKKRKCKTKHTLRLKSIDTGRHTVEGLFMTMVCELWWQSVVILGGKKKTVIGNCTAAGTCREDQDVSVPHH